MNEEINKNLKLKNDNNLKGNKDVKLYFMSTEQAIHFSVSCDNSDIFSKLEEEFYLEYPNLNNQNMSFIVNGNEINRTATIEENEIKNGDTILIKDIE